MEIEVHIMPVRKLGNQACVFDHNTHSAARVITGIISSLAIGPHLPRRAYTPIVVCLIATST